MVENQKNKGTLHPKTLKVQEKKVSLFVSFLTNWLRYGFDKFSNVAFIRRRNPHHSQYLAPSRKQNLQFWTQSIRIYQKAVKAKEHTQTQQPQKCRF